MNREELRTLIKQGINDAIVSKLKGVNSDDEINKTTSYLNSEEITEEDVDSILFFGGGKPKPEKEIKKITLKEAMDNNAKLKTSEIKEFESSFSKVLEEIPGSMVEFNKQKNNYSLSAIKKPGGIELLASGVLSLGSNGKISWSYSLQNGVIINAQNLKVTETNKGAVDSLYKHYQTWQKTWIEKLNFPQAGPTGVE